MAKKGLLLVCLVCFLLGACCAKIGDVSRQPPLTCSTLLLNDNGTHQAERQKAAESIVRIKAEGKNSIKNGTGVVWKTEGTSTYILTCAHLFSGDATEKIYVFPYGVNDNFSGYSGAYIGGFSDFDVGLVSVEQEISGFVSIAEAANTSLFCGSATYTFGNASGLGLACFGGVLSVPYENIGNTGSLPRLLHRIDRKLSHGCSGGGVFLSDGSIIGMVLSRTKTEDRGEDVYFSYAIPWEMATAIGERILRQKPDDEKIAYPFDFSIMPMTKQGQDKKTYTALVVIKTEGEMAGYFTVGDELLSATVGGREIIFSAYHEWVTFCLSHSENADISIKVKHFGVEKEVEISTKATP